MASKIKVDQLETADGTGTIALQNQLSGLASASMPTGSVLQVVISEHSTQTTLATTTYTDIGHSATITPSSTSSKVLVMWDVHARTTLAGTGFGTRLVRGSTTVWTSANTYQQYFANAGEIHSATNQVYIDSPSTTSATTYKVQAASDGSKTIKVNANSAQTQLVLMEIAG